MDNVTLQESFQNFVEQQQLFDSKSRLLVGVSGGVDSVVLCHLLWKANISFAMAHCNFQLRGKDADADESFVTNLAKSYEREIYSIHFNTYEYASQKKVSIQMAARDLRYDWFHQLAKEKGFTQIAVGTHLSDNVETFFINMIRGTGLSGITGITPKNGLVIRPLLFATREQILHYATAENLAWREDLSNSDTKYLRNKIRHDVIPSLKEIKPNIEQIFSANMDRFKEVELFFEEYIEALKETILVEVDSKWSIQVDALMKEKNLKLILFHLIKEFGFNSAQNDDILAALTGSSGKIFYSGTHQLLIDRNQLHITEIETFDRDESYLIDERTYSIDQPLSLKMKIISSEGFQIIKDENIACLDRDKLTFPLVLRRWKAGDRFVPLGMNREKKVSDFLIDTKTSIQQKQNTWVLTSGNQIVWIVGKRIDNRYRLDSQSKKVYLMSPFSKD